MEYFDVDIGLRELYSLKNFNFDIINNGSADIDINRISTSSENIEIPFINLPFTIMQNSTYSMYGYIKILNNDKSFHNDYIDLDISFKDENGYVNTDVYRYFINYEGTIYPSYTNIIEINNILYINNILSIQFSADVDIINWPTVVLKSIDNYDYYIFPEKYILSSNKIAYVFYDNLIMNKYITNNIKLLMISDFNYLNILTMTHRTI